MSIRPINTRISSYFFNSNLIFGNCCNGAGVFGLLPSHLASALRVPGLPQDIFTVIAIGKTRALPARPAL